MGGTQGGLVCDVHIVGKKTWVQKKIPTKKKNCRYKPSVSLVESIQRVINAVSDADSFTYLRSRKEKQERRVNRDKTSPRCYSSLFPTLGSFPFLSPFKTPLLKKGGIKKRLPILPHLRFPPFAKLLILALLGPIRQLALDAFAGPEHFALEVETPAVGHLVGVEQLLEPVRHVLHLQFPRLRRLHVQDLAGFRQRQARGGQRRGSRGRRLGRRVGRGVGVRGRGLAPRFGDGAPQHARAAEDDLNDDPVGLGRRIWVSLRTERGEGGDEADRPYIP